MLRLTESVIVDTGIKGTLFLNDVDVDNRSTARKRLINTLLTETLRSSRYINMDEEKRAALTDVDVAGVLSAHNTSPVLLFEGPFCHLPIAASRQSVLCSSCRDCAGQWPCT